MERHAIHKKSFRETKNALPRTDRSGFGPLICGIVIAGGEGQRLKSFVHLLRGDLLPKQYVTFIGTRSMLEHTFHRAERLVPPDRLLTIINYDHLRFPEVRRQLSARRAGTIVLQPENRDTAAGITLPLIHLYKRYPDSVVVIFPSDHFVLEEDRLVHSIRLACRTVNEQPSRVLLLGIKPDNPEPDYGYLIPGKPISASLPGAFEISDLIEKPDIPSARLMIQRGALWNTLVLISKTVTLLEYLKELKPDFYTEFMKIYRSIGTPNEVEVTRGVYQNLAMVNFSTEILSPLAQRRPSCGLMAAPLSNVLWSDWGTEGRVLETLRRTGNEARLNGIGSTLYQQRSSVERQTLGNKFQPSTKGVPQTSGSSETRRGVKKHRASQAFSPT